MGESQNKDLFTMSVCVHDRDVANRWVSPYSYGCNSHQVTWKIKCRDAVAKCKYKTLVELSDDESDIADK